MQLAEYLGLEVRQIRNLEKQGVVQYVRRRGTTKLYSLGTCVQRYIRWHTAAAEETSPKARLERANADEAEARAELARLKLAQMREALVDPERAHQRMRAALNVVAAQVLQLSGQAAVDLLHLEDTLAVEQALQPHLDRIIRDAGQALLDHLDADEEADDDDAPADAAPDDEVDDAAG